MCLAVFTKSLIIFDDSLDIKIPGGNFILVKHPFPNKGIITSAEVDDVRIVAEIELILASIQAQCNKININ
jgi:hypothetical protein